MAENTVIDIKNLAGYWRSEYVYRNSDRGQNLTSTHYVKLIPKASGFVVETVRRVNQAYMIARFSVDDRIATGSWQESTSLEGDYNGIMYHGAAQLIIAKDGKSMQGQWVGFGKTMEVKNGPWSFEFLGVDASVLDDVKIAAGQ